MIPFHLLSLALQLISLQGLRVDLILSEKKNVKTKGAQRTFYEADTTITSGADELRGLEL